MDNKVYISADGDKIGRMVGRASLADDVPEISRLNQAINKGNDVWKSWVIANGGDIISIGGDEIRVSIQADHLEDLDKLRDAYSKMVGATVSVGVGLKMSEADKALMSAKLNGGDRIVFYSEAVEKDIEQASQHQESEEHKLFDEYLDKAEHPMQGHFDNVIKEQDKKKELESKQVEDSETLRNAKSQIVQVLQGIRAQSQDLEAIKMQAPELYNAINQLIQGLISLGRTMGSNEPIQKAENHKFHMDMPVNFVLPPGPTMTGKNSGGRIKVLHQNGKTSWVHATSGLVMSPEGVPASARNPSGTHAGKE